MDTNLVNEILGVGIEVLGVALLVLVSIYVPRLFRALEKRIGHDIPDPLEDEAERLALRAIGYAEECARKAARKLGDKMPSQVKLQQAAGWFRANARPQVVEYLSGRVEGWIEAVLGEYRHDGAFVGVGEGPVPSWIKEEKS